MSLASHNTPTEFCAAGEELPDGCVARLKQCDSAAAFLSAMPALVIVIALAVLAALVLLAPSALVTMDSTASDDALASSILSLVFAGGAAAFAALLLTATCCLDARKPQPR